MIARTSTTLALALFAAASGLRGQTQNLDQGTFRILVHGQPVGTETFSIQRKGAGASSIVVSQGRVTLDNGEQTRTLIQTEGPSMRPTAYQIEATGPDRQSIRGQAAGNRFRAQIVSGAGEMMREFLTSDGAVVIDQDVAHQYYFLGPHLRNGARVPVIIPRQSRQVPATITAGGRETIDVGGQQVSARKFTVSPAGMSPSTIWVDDQGRVLRLDVPDQDYLAERTAMP